MNKYDESLRIQKNIHGERDHLDIALSLNNIGSIYFKKIFKEYFMQIFLVYQLIFQYYYYKNK